MTFLHSPGKILDRVPKSYFLPEGMNSGLKYLYILILVVTSSCNKSWEASPLRPIGLYSGILH